MRPFNPALLSFRLTHHPVVALYALEVLGGLLGAGKVQLADGQAQLTDGVVLAEAIKVVHRQHQGTAHHLAVGDLCCSEMTDPT